MQRGLGGPAYMCDQRRAVIIFVELSHGVLLVGRKKKPGVYTDVSKYVGRIENHMKIQSELNKHRGDISCPGGHHSDKRDSSLRAQVPLTRILVLHSAGPWSYPWRKGLLATRLLNLQPKCMAMMGWGTTLLIMFNNSYLNGITITRNSQHGE